MMKLKSLLATLTVGLGLLLSSAPSHSSAERASPLPSSIATGNRSADETAAFVHLSPDSLLTVSGCAEFSVAIVATFVDARVFSLRFCFDDTNFNLLAVHPGANPSLYVMPESLSADTLCIDGYFHPNFTGTDTIVVLAVEATSPSDTSSLIGFIQGRGWSGTSEIPVPIFVDGDSTTVLVDAVPPKVPARLVIEKLHYPAHDDSVCLHWLPVRYDEVGRSVTNPLYFVYLEDVLNDTLLLRGATLDTFFFDDYIESTFSPNNPSNVGVYTVRACKTQP